MPGKFLSTRLSSFFCFLHNSRMMRVCGRLLAGSLGYHGSGPRAWWTAAHALRRFVTTVKAEDPTAAPLRRKVAAPVKEDHAHPGLAAASALKVLCLPFLDEDSETNSSLTKSSKDCRSKPCGQATAAVNHPHADRYLCATPHVSPNLANGEMQPQMWVPKTVFPLADPD